MGDRQRNFAQYATALNQYASKCLLSLISKVFVCPWRVCNMKPGCRLNCFYMMDINV